MRSRSIGGLEVSAIGLGGMPMSIEGRPEEQRSIATIHAALDAGVTLIDTADAYHLKPGETGHNERLIARALATYGGDTSGVLVATKGGHVRPGDGSWTVDGFPGPPARGRGGVAEGARRGRHRPLPVPPSRPRGPVRGVDRGPQGPARRGQDPAGRHLQRDGRADRHRAAGFSARATWPASRTSSRRPSGPAKTNCGTAPASASRSCPGARSAASAGPANSAPEHSAFQEVADAHGVSPQRVTLAWMLALAPVVIPIPGARGRSPLPTRPRHPTWSSRTRKFEQLSRA